MSLLYRARNRSNECVEDYIDRLGYHNGFNSQTRFLDWLDKNYESLYADSGWFSDGDEWNNRHMFWHKRLFAIEAMLNKSTYRIVFLSKCGLNNSTPRICQTCWNEAEYIRSYWHLAVYKECHVHGEPMTDFEGYGVDWKSKVRKRVLNSTGGNKQVVLAAAKMYSGEDNCLENILIEQFKCDYEAELIRWMYRLLGESLSERVNDRLALDLCLSGKMVGQSIDERMSRYVRALGGRSESKRQLLRAVAILKMNVTRVRSQVTCCAAVVRSFREWARRELFSNDDLFFAYIKSKSLRRTKGKGTLTRSDGCSLKKELHVARKISPYVDSRLAQLISSANTKDPYGGDWQSKLIFEYEQYVDKQDEADIRFDEFLAELGSDILRSSRVRRS